MTLFKTTEPVTRLDTLRVTRLEGRIKTSPPVLPTRSDSFERMSRGLPSVFVIETPSQTTRRRFTDLYTDPYLRPLEVTGFKRRVLHPLRI